jgi:hypothetical protein
MVVIDKIEKKIVLNSSVIKCVWKVEENLSYWGLEQKFYHFE